MKTEFPVKAPFYCLVESCLLFACCLSADADIILGYNTTYPFPQAGPLSDITFASSFTVGGRDVEITSMKFLFEGVAAHNYETSAYIFSDSGGQPGVALAFSERSFAPWNLDVGFYDYTFSSPLTLSAGTAYWAGFGFATPSGAPIYISYAYNLNDFAGNGVTPSLAFASSGDYPPSQFSVNAPTQTLVYQLEGSVVPEPSSVALALLGFSAFAIRRLLPPTIERFGVSKPKSN